MEGAGLHLRYVGGTICLINAKTVIARRAMPDVAIPPIEHTLGDSHASVRTGSE